MRFHVAIIATAVCLAPILFPAVAPAQSTGAGSLDPTFHAATIPLDRGITFLRLLPDGGIVAGGLASVPAGTPGGSPVSAPRLARFGADGSLVPAYGANALAVGGNLLACEVDPTGRLLVVDSGGPVARLRRLNADGTADPVFGFPLPSGWSDFTAVAVQVDGRILVGGRFARPFTGDPRLALVRLRDDGFMDDAFRPGPAPGGGFGDVAALLPTPDGRVLVGSGDYGPGIPPANATPSTRLGRFNADGSADGSFRTAEADYELGALAFQPPAGDVLVSVYGHATRSDNSRQIIRLRGADGTVDDTFTPFTPRLTSTSPLLAVQPDGRLLVGDDLGVVVTGPTDLLRLNVNGSPDITFRSAVFIAAVVGPAYGVTGALGPVVVQPDGRVLVASVTSRVTFFPGQPSTSTHGIFLDRLLADPSPKRPDLAVSFPGVFAITRPDPAAPNVGKYKLAGPVRLLNQGNKSARDFSLTAYATARLDLYSPGQAFNPAADPTLRPLQLTATTDANFDLAALRARFDLAAAAPAPVRVRKLAAGETRDVPLKLTYAADQEPGLKGLSLLLVVDAENRFQETDETNNARVYYALP